MKSPRLVVLLALTALPFAPACRPRNTAASVAAAVTLPALRFRPDRRYLYEVTLDSRVSYGAGADLVLALSGRLRVTPAARAEGGADLLALAFEEPRFAGVPDSAAAEYGALAVELTKGFVLALDQGQVRELRAPGQPSPFAANIFQTVAQAFALPAGQAQTPWTAEATDAGGRYVAAWTPGAAPGRYTKRKLRYLDAALSSPQLQQMAVTLTPKIVGSQGALSLTDGALGSFTYEEDLETGLGTQGSARAHNRLTLNLQTTEPSDARPRAELLAATSPLPAGQPRPAAGDRRALDASKIGDFTFDSALARLRIIVRGKATLLASEKTKRQASAAENEERDRLLADHNRVFSALGAILRTQPDTVGRALAQVRKGSDVAGPLIDALGAADSEAAQAGLVQLARDSRLSEELRSAAALALIRVETPSAATVASLIDLTRDPVVRLYAIYGLGTQARRLRDRGQGELAARAGRALVERLQGERNRMEIVHLLRGISNSAFAGALPVVRPLLEDKDDTVRGAAVEALRWMDDPAVDGLIAGRLQKEARPFALRAALNAARTRRPSPALSEAVAAVATTAKDDHGRYAAIELLARWRPAQPSLREVLDRVARTDAVPAVREAARAAL